MLVPDAPVPVGGQLAAAPRLACWPAATGPSTGCAGSASSVAMVATDEFAFGDDVPASYVEFVDEMLSATPFEVVAEFFPNFAALDKFDAVEALSAGCRPRSSAAPRTS